MAFCIFPPFFPGDYFCTYDVEKSQVYKDVEMSRCLSAKHSLELGE